MVLNRKSLDLSDFLSKYLPVSCSLLSCRPAWAQAPGPSTPHVPGSEGAPGLSHRGGAGGGDTWSTFHAPPAAFLGNPAVALNRDGGGFAKASAGAKASCELK